MSSFSSVDGSVNASRHALKERSVVESTPGTPCSHASGEGCMKLNVWHLVKTVSVAAAREWGSCGLTPPNCILLVRYPLYTSDSIGNGGLAAKE